MEIPISRDIRKFKTKDIGNFSFKEAGFLAAGVGTAALTYKLANSLELALIPLCVILVIGFLKPYGMSFITFLRTVGAEKLTTPCYINETDFVYDSEEFEKLYGKDSVISADFDVIQTTVPAKINKEDRKHFIC